MITPALYNKNLEKRIITQDMLEDALYSVNKRAKNWRNQKRKYKHSYDRYGNADKAETEERQMYAYKEKFLSLVTPLCIHREFAGYERIRVYDYEQNYSDLFVEYALRGRIVWMNSFFDYQ